jgi:ornithine cyclodeaminase
MPSAATGRNPGGRGECREKHLTVDACGFEQTGNPVTRIIKLDQIKRVLDPIRVIQALEEGFVEYSEGRVTVPPVGHLYFKEPPGDCHIKYGYVAGDSHFVIKVATGFYRNPEIGLPSSNGLMLVFNRKTGQPDAILLDEGWLTDARTAAAGAIAAKHLGRRKLTGIGIVGTGTQARMQLEWLRHVTDCREATVWGRSREKAELFRDDMAGSGYSIGIAARLDELCARSDLIVTTTPSREPLLHAEQIKPGTHITAVGADGGGKQELDAAVFGRADICVVDSLSQCREYGDTARALREGVIAEDRLIELGRVIRDSALGRRHDGQITIADLTGVAVQDIRIATMVLNSL